MNSIGQWRSRPAIVVVGSGVIGACTALCLAQRGVAVVLVDAGPPATGTTPAGAGFVAPWATADLRWGQGGLLMEQFSIGFYRRLSRHAEVGLRANGNIGFYTKADTCTAGLAVARASPFASPDMRVLNPAEIAELSGGMVDANRITGGVFMPSGVQLETELALAAITELAQQTGRVAVRYNTRVEHIVTRDDVAVAVATTGAEITAAAVVLATGAWLSQLCGDLGLRLPLTPFVAVRLITVPAGVPANMPTFQGHDLGLWIRESAGGFTWGSTAAYTPAQRLTPDPSTQPPGPVWSPVLSHRQRADTERIAEVFPVLRDASVAAELQGMPVYTPDHGFVIGQVPFCRNVWVAGGDNEAGVSHAPGIGRLVADMITGAAPLCDPTPYRLDRFERSSLHHRVGEGDDREKPDRQPDELGGTVGTLTVQDE